MSHLITINDQKFLLWQSNRKLTLFTLSDLKSIQRYYIDVNFVYCHQDGLIMIIAKNIVTFLKPVLHPLRLIQTQQQFLQWQPLGGLCLSSSVILFDAHVILFYDRARNFQKTWSISVVQKIKEIKNSSSQSYIGMKVKQCDNAIYLWNLHDISTKPNQQISITEPILQWQFYTNDILVLLSTVQFRVYQLSPKNQYYLQYYIGINDPKEFCWLQSAIPINMHESRRSVHTIAILTNKHEVMIYELYDITKRMRNSHFNFVRSIQIAGQYISKILGGWQKNSKIIVAGEGANSKPFCWQLKNDSSKYVIDRVINHKKDLADEGTARDIHYRDGIIAVFKQDHINLFQLQGSSNYKFIKTINALKGCLGSHYFYEIEKDRFLVHPIKGQKVQQIEAKCSQDLQLIIQKDNVVHFLSGVRLYKYADRKLETNGIVIRNPNAKLVEVNIYTQTLLYKIGSEFMVMEYSQSNGKITAKTVKSSENKLIGLRKSKWLELKQNQIVFGIQQKTLANFSLTKMYKTLDQQKADFQYNVYWIAHHGVALLVRNYLFILQLIQNAEGYSLVLLKKGHNYMHKRFSPYSQICILNPRQMVVRVKNRVVRLGNRLGSLVSEDPYSLPETTLYKQLLTRKFYPPHHPKIIDNLIGSGNFHIAVMILLNVSQTIKKKGQLSTIYEHLDFNFFIKNGNLSAEEVKLKLLELSSEENIDSLKSLAAQILQDPSKVVLEQAGPLVMENQIQALIYRNQNSRSMDFFSSMILTHLHTNQHKNMIFNTRHVALMLHSINKEEAISFMKPQKLSWDWMKKYSVPLWYNNTEALKKWIQEIAGNEFRREKEPFDCLFWYLLIGKKSLLSNLFKANQHSSKQHVAIFTFLQRDFSQPKDQSAAIKNAYVLMDKKRFYHSLAFFLLGQKFEECISLCLNRLNDITLAYTISVLFNYQKNKVLNVLLEKGDVWAKHIAYNLQGKHVDSYNCLFQDEQNHQWDFTPQLCYYHPCIISFAEQLQNSVSIKRELQEQQMQQRFDHSQSNDIFESFNQNQNSQTKNSIEKQPKKQLMSNFQAHKKRTYNYYLQNGFPALALMIDPESIDAKRTYQLQQMILTGKITPSTQQIVEQLEDIKGLLKKQIQQKQLDKCQKKVKQFNQDFRKVLKKVNLSEIYPSDKQIIGSLLYYCFHGEEIITLFDNQNKFYQNHLADLLLLKEMTALSKILISLELKIYKEFDKICEFNLRSYTYNTEEYWSLLKSQYNKLPVYTKIKHQKLMDCFQHTFHKFARREKQEGHGINAVGKLFLESRPAITLTLNHMVINRVSKLSNAFGEQLNEIKLSLDRLLKTWVNEDLLKQIKKQFKMIKKEGPGCRLKLALLGQFFGQSFKDIANALNNVLQIRQQIAMNERKVSEEQVRNDKEAVQIFRNKQDGVRSFTINKNEGNGMQIVVLFKKGIKKIQVCQSLTQRNRSNDGYTLIHEDPFYNSPSTVNVQTLLQNPPTNPMLRQKLNKVINNRRSYDGIGQIKNSGKRGDTDFMRPCDPIPYLDHNELNSIECHYYLPILLVGGKGLIDVINYTTLRNFNRIQCPSMHQITKLWSFEQRVTALDSSGNLGSYNFDSKYTNNCVFSLKKAGIVDFCPLNPSTVGTITNNTIQIFDTLLNPVRQSIFKLKISNEPIAIRPLSDWKFVVMRKSQLLIYDIRSDRLEQTKDIEAQGRSMTTNYKDKIIAGRVDGKLKVFDLSNSSEFIIKVGKQTEKKNPVQIVSTLGSCGICQTGEGSIYLLDQL